MTISDNSFDVLLDYDLDPRLVIEDLLKHWQYDLYARKPGPALLDSGVLHPSDLDMACVLSALADRRAVINIPEYETRRAASKVAGERVVSKDNRHGRILGVVPNQDTFSFGVRIEDMNVITSEAVGAPRTFTLVDFEGQFYPGWETLEFMPTAKENEFLRDNELFTGNKIFFKHFVHPNRWVSFYGQYYALTKLAIDRVTQEAAYARMEAKRLRGLGIRRPDDKERGEWPKTESGPSQTQKVMAFEVEVDAPWQNARPRKLADAAESLAFVEEFARKMTYEIKPKLVFAARCTELAFAVYGVGRSLPVWAQNGRWEDGYRTPKGRIDWNRFAFKHGRAGELGIALRAREYERSERVKA